MFKYILTLLLILTLLSTKGQNTFYKYKKIADQLINKNFDTSLIHIIKCDGFYLKFQDKTMNYYNYPQEEQVKLGKETLYNIEFKYTFFSSTLRNNYSFIITLDSRNNPIYKKALFENIPICVRLNTSCDFISKDSAIKIALSDSIKYSDNILITFEQARQTNTFYWVFSSQPKSKPPKKSRCCSGYGFRDNRYIDALTGEIISRQKFYQNPR